jgi:hypothetical protein
MGDRAIRQLPEVEDREVPAYPPVMPRSLRRFSDQGAENTFGGEEVACRLVDAMADAGLENDAKVRTSSRTG